MSKIGLPLINESSMQTQIRRNEALVEKILGKRMILEKRLAQLRGILTKMVNEIKTSEEYSKLADMRKKRKDHEKEILSLKNNIERLKNIECRLWREIKLFNSRSRKMEESKRRNMIKKRVKEKEVEKLQRSVRKKRRTCNEWKAQIREKINMKKDILYLKKRQNFEKMRKERLTREKKIKRFRQRAISLKTMRRNHILRQTNIGKIKRKLITREKRAEVTHRIKKDRLKEKKKLFKMQKDIDDMCVVEDKWLNKLKASKELHDLALEHLNKAYETGNLEESLLPTEHTGRGSSEGGKVPMRDSYISEELSETGESQN